MHGGCVAQPRRAHLMLESLSESLSHVAGLAREARPARTRQTKWVLG